MAWGWAAGSPEGSGIALHPALKDHRRPMQAVALWPACWPCSWVVLPMTGREQPFGLRSVNALMQGPDAGRGCRNDRYLASLPSAYAAATARASNCCASYHNLQEYAERRTNVVRAWAVTMGILRAGPLPSQQAGFGPIQKPGGLLPA